MASPFVPAQATARFMPPSGVVLRQTSAQTHPYHASQTQSNQCDDAGHAQGYPTAASYTDWSKPHNAKQLFCNGPERDGCSSELSALREENRALYAQLAELSRSHQLQIDSLQRQLAEAHASNRAVELRLATVAASGQSDCQAVNSAAYWPPPAALSYQHQPLASNTGVPQQQARTWAPPQPYHHQQQQRMPDQAQPQRRFHPYARQQQQQQAISPPPCNGQTPPVFPYAAPALTSQAPPDDKRPTGGLFAYCSGIISASLPSSTVGSASVMPSVGFKVAPSWKLFSRSTTGQDDEETGRGAPLLPLEAPSTSAGDALRDPTV